MKEGLLVICIHISYFINLHHISELFLSYSSYLKLYFRALKRGKVMLEVLEGVEDRAHTLVRSKIITCELNQSKLENTYNEYGL